MTTTMSELAPVDPRDGWGEPDDEADVEPEIQDGGPVRPELWEAWEAWQGFEPASWEYFPPLEREEEW